MWRNRNIWLIMSGEAIAGMGMWVGIIGNLEFLQHTVSSDTLKSFIILCNTYVGLFLGPYAGRLIDSHRKKPIINLAGLLRIISVLFMFGALATNNVWWMVVYMLLLGTSATFFFPAWQSIIPMVVPKDQLLKVNSLYMTVSTLTRVLGTAFGGVLLLYMSLTMMYICTIASYIILFVITLLLKLDEKPAAKAEQAMDRPYKKGSGFKELWPMLKASPAVFVSLLLTFVPALFLGGFNLVILKISEIQADTSIKAWLYTAEGLSFLAGSVLAKRLGDKRNLMNVLLVCTLVFAFTHAALIAVSVKAVVVAAFACFGFAAGVFYPILTTLYQKGVSADMHGRFFSLVGMMDRLLFQIVLVATGVLLDVLGFQLMETVLAVCSFTLVGYYVLKQLRSPIKLYNRTEVGKG